MGEIVLIRHGETEWSRTGKHTGRTDVALTAYGEQQARALEPILADRNFALVLTSPLQRAVRTAELAGLPDPQREPGLSEWDYGVFEELTTREIEQRRPGWQLWRDGVEPGGDDHPGETLEAVAARLDRVLERARIAMRDGDVALVAHGHSLRIAGARWIGLPGSAGGLLALGTAALCLLDAEHGRPVITAWNLPNPAVQA